MARFQKNTKVTSGDLRQSSGKFVKYNGIYTAVIKDNRDVNRNGRLRVWVPEFGSDEFDDTGWITVSYASPFAGATPIFALGKDLTDYKETQNSYGMWFIPPDVSNHVLVAFAGGDPGRGYWFACVFQNFMNQSVPSNGALPSSKHYGPDTGDTCDLPVGEYNKYSKERSGPVVPDNERKPVHQYHASGLKNQGLIHDDVRGVTNSSARREAPSNVFGISTPGPLDENSTQYHLYRTLTDNGPKDYAHRKGGHQFVLDDHPENEHIRLRTRSGAQIKIDETNGIIYIVNRDGTAWFEMSESGHIDMYAKKSYSVRSEQDFNFRADRDINIEAGRNVNIKAAKDYIDPVSAIKFIAEYANANGKTFSSLFPREVKIDLINNYPEYKVQYEQNPASLNKIFDMLMIQLGAEDVGDTPDFGVPNIQSNKVSITAVELQDLIRGSKIIGELLGNGGNVKIQANNDFDLMAQSKMNLTALDGDANMFIGGNFNHTVGLSKSETVGTELKIAAGTTLDLSCGTDGYITVGGNGHFSVYGDTKVYTRGDVDILLEGLALSVEVNPHHFPNNGLDPREPIPEPRSRHETKFKLENVEVYSENIKMFVQGNTQNPFGNFDLTATGSIRQTADQFQDIIAGIQYRLTSPDVQIQGAPAIPAEIPMNPPSLQPADPSVVGSIATFAVTPTIYAKNNVLETFDTTGGSKQYCLTYHTQIVESIVKRFNTHEPCVEHEYHGDLNKKPEKFLNAVAKYRHLD